MAKIEQHGRSQSAIPQESTPNVPAPPATPALDEKDRLVQEAAAAAQSANAGPRPWAGQPAVVGPVAVGATPKTWSAPIVGNAFRVIAEFFDHPRLSKLAEQVTKGESKDGLDHLQAEFVKEMGKLRDQYSELRNNSGKVRQFEEAFGGFERRLDETEMSAEEFFSIAGAGPVYLAAKIRGTKSLELDALYEKVAALVERVSDEVLESGKTAASNVLGRPNPILGSTVDTAAVEAKVGQAMTKAVERLAKELKQMVDAGEITDADRDNFMSYGVERLNAVKEIEIGKHAYPVHMNMEIGSPQWKAMVDQVAGAETVNNNLSVNADGVSYEDALTKIVAKAGPKIFISILKPEADQKSSKFTDALSLKVRDAKDSVTSWTIINQVAAKKLEMPYLDYQRLRVVNNLEAKEIRDLRIAQEQLRRESGKMLDITATPLPEALEKRLEQLSTLSEDDRKNLARQLFTKCDVKFITDGKFPDQAMIGSTLSLLKAGLGHSWVDYVKGVVIGAAKADARIAAVTAVNDADPHRFLIDALGALPREFEDKYNFLRHPIRYAFGAPRDLEDIGVRIAYENKLFDKKGVNIQGLFRVQHEKIVASIDDEGVGHFEISGNNIGAKHTSYTGADGEKYVRFHDAGVYGEGGRGSVVEDIMKYETTRHWNDVVKDKHPDWVISDDEAKSWLPTSEAQAGTTSARLLTIEPDRHRGLVSMLMAGMASANKRIFMINPFVSGDEFIRQAIAAADRWKREGWDPKKKFNPKDPASMKDPTVREFVVIMPKWLDGGIAQAASYKAIRDLQDHGITVLRWTGKNEEAKRFVKMVDEGKMSAAEAEQATGMPMNELRRAAKGVTGDGKAMYDRKAMLHTKAFTFQSVGSDGKMKGFSILGSTNLMNPVFTGNSREIGIYSEDPTYLEQVDQLINLPDMRNSEVAKRPPAVVAAFNKMVGFATKWWQ